METILSHRRRKLGDFEVVDFVDEAEISALRSQIDVSVPLELHWTWDYGSQVEELRALYERGKKGQWNAEEDIDWSMPMPRDQWFMAKEGGALLPSVLHSAGASDDVCREAAWDEFSHLISQLLHGEQAALQLCGQLVNTCPTMDQKWYAGSQVIDEVRHVEVFAKFLQRKMGVIHPIDPTLKVLLDKLLAAPTWKTKVLGMQTLFEGMAVGIMDLVKRSTTSPLVADIITRVHQDEARHAAFGILSMRRIVRESSTEEMAEMEDFAFNVLETLNANQQLDMLHVFGPKYGLDPDSTVQMMHSYDGWGFFNSEPFMHTVIPNLKRLGLITERTEHKYRERGIIHGDKLDFGRDPLPLAS
ncbi:MAG TPA: ferritin-like domain-containing protein [Candidatus Limnocylindrales bacterium]|nr:ferritin-like domain-containing protein [Candidatus Limnocylindrales bacterium]